MTLTPFTAALKISDKTLEAALANSTNPFVTNWTARVIAFVTTLQTSTTDFEMQTRPKAQHWLEKQSSSVLHRPDKQRCVKHYLWSLYEMIYYACNLLKSARR